MTSELKPCKNCGSLDQSWQDGKRVTTGVSHNRLNLNDVEAFFFLGCNACGETLRYMSCEAISEQLNTRATPSADTLAGVQKYGDGEYVLYS
ncbi:translation initiation factor 2 beta subunit (eIF-2beta)/eIF-5 [Paenochrobactrum gallinarii]|uniref:Translation initiation factor 2 beta subunit (eIF-2beta)/eIF-5 n=1 Tax=Paenochrobactrum gallinarii TaxID=643673 RepID=A0A841M8R3_9HYPH|nr:hypothetical protein [Paenochrobactrum gallinarii]MBB6262528.1 translation initiation factor 2 beta subunit (eIF-2beta)/eIF-5 [Paenochrobactrum gallinarii]